MATYTFITDYLEGTYICQKEASDLRTASFMWKEEMSSESYVPNLKAKAFSKSFEADFDEFPPLQIDGLQNVWIFHLLIGSNQMDLHIIQTDVASVEAEIGSIPV